MTIPLSPPRPPPQTLCTRSPSLRPWPSLTSPSRRRWHRPSMGRSPSPRWMKSVLLGQGICKGGEGLKSREESRRACVCPSHCSLRTSVHSSKIIGEETVEEATEEEADMAVAWKQTFFPFLFPALGGLLFGYDIGATSGALLSLKDPILSGTDWYNISSTATGLVVSGSLAGALLGSALAFLVADPLGRRRELILASLLYASGAACTASAGSLPVLLLGRLIYGLGIGLAMHGAPMYIAETSPPSIRGILISLKEGFIVGGILIGYLSGSVFIDDVGGWREILGLGVPVAMLMTAGMWWLPPSPRWLLLRYTTCEEEPSSGSSDSPESSLLRSGDRGSLREQAVQSLQRLRGDTLTREEAEKEVEDIIRSEESRPDALQDGDSRPDVLLDGESRPDAVVVNGITVDAAADAVPEPSTSLNASRSFQELFRGPNLVALQIAGGLVIFQQITGQPSVLYYAASILQDAGFSAAADATKVSVVLGLFKLLMTGVAVLLVDKAGRRPLLLVGVSGLVLSLFILGTVYQLDLSFPALNVAALLLYVGSYQVSFGPISWLMVSEIFALKVRGRAQSIATLLNFGSNALVTFALPPIQEAIGQAGTFYAFGVIGLASLSFVALFVPETKGLTLEQITAKLSSNE